MPVVAARLGRKFIAGDVSYRAVHTSRTRLVAASGPAFMVKQIAGLGPAKDDMHIIEDLNLELDGNSIKLAAKQLESIDYWEVDPAWKGKLFRSAVQAVRPHGKGKIIDRLNLPARVGEHPICARVVDIHGSTCRIKV